MKLFSMNQCIDMIGMYGACLIKFKFLVLDFSKNGKTSLMLLILEVIQLWCAW
jgi:hypothetical protein